MTNKSKKRHIILITGVPGVGKTSIAKTIADKFKLPLVNFGDVLFNRIKKDRKYKITAIDDIRYKLPFKDYHQLQVKSAKDISKTKHNIILTSHLSISTPTGFMPGFPKQVIEVLQPTILFIIESPSDQIRKRREQDKDQRIRGVKLEKLIDFHQHLNRSLAADYSYVTGNYIFPIINMQGHLDDAISEIESVINELIK